MRIPKDDIKIIFNICTADPKRVLRQAEVTVELVFNDTVYNDNLFNSG